MIAYWRHTKNSSLIAKKSWKRFLHVLAENGQEATGSMGDDTPFAVLSQRPRLIYDYFRQNLRK